jgi:NADH-quinone oxidoreductase subunit L
MAVVLTAFYTFRMVLLTFHGEPRTETAEDPEPLGWNMKFPLVVLGFLSVVAGVLNLGVLKKVVGEENLFLHEWLDGASMNVNLESFGLSVEHYHHVLTHEFGAGYEATDLSPYGPGALSLGLAVAGLVGAWYLYSGDEPAPHMTKLGGIRTILMNNYYQDEYQVWLATGLTAPLARLANTFDQGIIDGVVDGTGTVSGFVGQRFRKIQTGVVTNYAALLTLGLVLLLLVFGLVGGWF